LGCRVGSTGIVPLVETVVAGTLVVAAVDVFVVAGVVAAVDVFVVAGVVAAVEVFVVAGVVAAVDVFVVADVRACVRGGVDWPMSIDKLQ
jgi:hypothetical protein